MVASAKITKAASGYSTGLSAQRLTHTTTGNTNYVHILKDDMTSSPSFGTSGSLSAGTNGTYRYVSGIPYYNSGSPTVNITGMTINNLVGQAYTNQSNIVEVDSGTNYEGTSSAASNANDYSYSDIDGATTMLDSGTPKVNIGTSSAYAIGDIFSIQGAHKELHQPSNGMTNWRLDTMFWYYADGIADGTITVSDYNAKKWATMIDYMIYAYDVSGTLKYLNKAKRYVNDLLANKENSTCIQSLCKFFLDTTEYNQKFLYTSITKGMKLTLHEYKSIINKKTYNPIIHIF